MPSALYPRIPLRSIRATLVTPFLARTFHPRIPLRSIRATLVTPCLARTFIPVFRFAPYGLRWLHHSSRAPSSPYSASLHTGYAGYTIPRVYLYPRIPLRSIRATLVTPFLACTFIPVFRFAPYGLRWLHPASRAPSSPLRLTDSNNIHAQSQELKRVFKLTLGLAMNGKKGLCLFDRIPNMHV